MATLFITEAPGGLGEAYQCPYCSRLYLDRIVDDSGQITAAKAEAPTTCQRCGSPMDVEKSQVFQDAQAAAAAPTAAGRRTRKV